MGFITLWLPLPYDVIILSATFRLSNNYFPRMRRPVFFIAVLLSLFYARISSAQQKEIFIKQLEFKLDHVSDKDYENEYFMTIKFNKGTAYKFKVTNHRDNFAGKAVFELLDTDNLILTNAINDKYFESFSFICNKTAFYDILIRYMDKKPGYSIVDISMLQ